MDEILFLNRNEHKLVHDYQNDVVLFETTYSNVIGHGSGFIFTQKEDVENFKLPINPLTGKEVKTWYLGDEGPEQTFMKEGINYASYEECRAYLVALYFTQFKHS